MKQIQLLIVILLFTFPVWTVNAQWTQRTNLNDYNVNTFLQIGTHIFAGTSHGVYLSTNDGTNWSAANKGLVTGISCLVMIGNNLFASDGMTGVYRSTDNGANWTAVNNGLSNLSVRALAVKEELILAGTEGSSSYNSGMFLTSDNGNTWSYINTGLENDSRINSIAVYEDKIFVTSNYYRGMLLGGVYLSTNNGSTWAKINNGLYNINCYPLAVVSVDRLSGPDLYVGDAASPNGQLPSGAHLSTDCGSSWQGGSLGIENQTVLSFTPFGEKVFAIVKGPYLPAIYLTTSHDSEWTSVNQDGLPNAEIISLSVIGTELYAGIAQKGIWSRPLSEITDIVDHQPDIPGNFLLNQNYPNPFNPQTNISFAIPQSRFVTLKIFDLLGKETATLVNEYKQAGNYTVKFDGSNLPSGVYFYRIEAGEFKEAKKFLLMK